MKADIQQFEFFDPKLRIIGLWIEQETGVEFISTSFYRIGDVGVHGQLPLRGLDLRCRLESMGKAIAAHINEHWQYDPSRPELKCAVIHGEGSNLHIHIQVHPNTIRRLL